MGFGSLGFSELAVIFIIVLVFFGPRRFPEIARSMGSAMREFRRSLNQIQRELEEVDPRKDIPGKDILDDLKSGKEALDDLRSGKPGKWLDPNQPKSKPTATPGARSGPEDPGPQMTGEAMATAAAAAASAPAWKPTTSATATPEPPATPEPQGAEAAEGLDGDDEQLPMFESGDSAGTARTDDEVARDADPTDGSRSD